MRIVLVSTVIPTPDNFRAASALSYHLLKYRPEGIEIVCYSFNSNGVPADMMQRIEEDLNMKIHLVKSSRLIYWLFKLHVGFLKNLLPYPFGYYDELDNKTVRAIKRWNPDGIWINGNSLSKISRCFSEYKRVMTLPDCVSLYYHRLMGDNYLQHSWLKMMATCDQYYKNLKMEQEYPADDNVTYHVVGEEDKNFLMAHNADLRVEFIRHPHYNYLPDKVIKFSQPKIKILIAGQYNLYMKTAFDVLLPVLCVHSELAEHYSITFLGKGWDFAVNQLKGVGYESQRLGFVDVYLEEIVKYDIQLTPISVGTGTKGKVLDALTNGLLVIGTPFAIENIAVKNGVSCLIYRQPDEVVTYLQDIITNTTHYENIADFGRKVVLDCHDRRKASTRLFELFK